MSSHRRSTKYFSRKFNARKALLRGLVVSLVEHERISTTVDKAKELRRHVEKAITLGKKGDLATRRLLLSRLPNEGTVEKIIADLSVRFKARPGGYTRIIKKGRRPGDTAEMAFVEFVDYDFEKKPGAVSETAVKGKAKKTKAATKDATSASKAKALKAKKAVKALAAKRKNVAKIQKASRTANR
jgi:large subunit ribosomal protein L17